MIGWCVLLRNNSFLSCRSVLIESTRRGGGPEGINEQKLKLLTPPFGHREEVVHASTTLIRLHAHIHADIHASLKGVVTNFQSFISRSDEQELLVRALGGLSGQCGVSSLEAVRVVFPGQLAIRAADLRFGRVSADPEHIVTDLRAAVKSFNQS